MELRSVSSRVIRREVRYMNAVGFLIRVPLIFVGLICVPQIVLASNSVSATLTAGQSQICGLNVVRFNEIGFTDSGLGTYSPTGLTGGETVALLVDENFSSCGSPTGAWLYVTGFISNPGSGWLISVTCSGVEKLSSAATFEYSGGQAEWKWSSVFGFVDNDQVSCTIVHN